MVATVLHNASFRAALMGLLGAAAADIQVFKSYRTWAEWKHFDLSQASIRWFWGAVTGAVMGTAYAQYV